MGFLSASGRSSSAAPAQRYAGDPPLLRAVASATGTVPRPGRSDGGALELEDTPGGGLTSVIVLPGAAPATPEAQVIS